MVTAVLLASNPRFVRTDEANRYYSEIVELLQYLGCTVTVVQPTEGLLSTCVVPDLVVVHGVQVERLDQLPEPPEVVVKLSHPDGVIDPKDLKWQQSGMSGIPPLEHFIFTDEQRLAVSQAVEGLKATMVQPVPIQSRQASGNRPGVR